MIENIFSRDVILHAIDYIHENPIRRELCQKVVDWKWSSARYYLNEPAKQQEPDLPFIHGLPTGALD